MLRCLLVFLAAVLLCAWLSPSKKLRESALQALDSSLRCGLDSLAAEDAENAEAAAVPLQRRRQVSSWSAAPTSTKRRRVTPFQAKKIAAAQDWRCACGCVDPSDPQRRGYLLDASYEIDHIIPLIAGGTNDESNLQALLRTHHQAKSSAFARGR